jgi:Holliday junction resolvase
VHFISPDRRGAQPFDIIAVKDDLAWAIDCKTCKDHIFRLSRLEDNQVNAFEKWLSCGNRLAYLAVLHDEKIYMVMYYDLKEEGQCDLDAMGNSEWMSRAYTEIMEED